MEGEDRVLIDGGIDIHYTFRKEETARKDAAEKIEDLFPGLL